MATNPDPLAQLNQDIDEFSADLTAKLAAIGSEIAGLKAGTPVTQAQIDALRAKVATAKTAVDTFNA